MAIARQYIDRSRAYRDDRLMAEQTQRQWVLADEFCKMFGGQLVLDLNILPVTLDDAEYGSYEAMRLIDQEDPACMAFIFKSGNSWAVKTGINREARVLHEAKLDLGHVHNAAALFVVLGDLWGVQ